MYLLWFHFVFGLNYFKTISFFFKQAYFFETYLNFLNCLKKGFSFFSGVVKKQGLGFLGGLKKNEIKEAIFSVHSFSSPFYFSYSHLISSPRLCHATRFLHTSIPPDISSLPPPPSPYFLDITWCKTNCCDPFRYQ